MTTARVSPFMAVVLAGLLVIAAGLDRPAGAANLEKAVFAGGCFWCMEEAFEGVEGVVSVTSGYIGGTKANPSYEEVSSGSTGHAEAVEVLFDPARTSYPKLLEVFWRNIDPTTPDRQFCDRGSQYRSAIFTLTELQERQAEESKRAVEQTKPFREPIVTQIVRATTFYPAEDYHQDFYKRNPIRYKFYKYNCGRVQRLEEVWGKSRG
ncbi:MAG TPA: peptide-methionine (S)-S-oxide reductase MsrA [Nitrospiraceae bacterium]|nr:peptide-methionine (S)-S-oxide reductase MsrA [Nitrospiraceae bacterium]